jgi:glycerate 2-kinase
VSALRSIDAAALPRFVVAAGKAARPMYAAAAQVCQPARSIVATSVERGEVPEGNVELFNASHPFPNAASVAAAEGALALATASASRGGLLVLLSGGASAMLVAPAPGISLADKTETARALMAAGAPIHELNCVRKHLSRIKGGRLAAAAGRTITLALSDVHGPIPDDPSVIASGPTVSDRTTFAEALDIIARRKIGVPRSVDLHLSRGARGEIEETVKPGDRRVGESVYTVVGNRMTAVEGARRAAEERGYRVVVFTEATAGEAREAGRTFVGRAAALEPRSRPLCVIAAGETTVTVNGDGAGGRNQEFALAAASHLDALGIDVVLGSAGTDGIDGPTPAAGAMVDTTSLIRADRMGLDWRAFLARNDSYPFFDRLDDLIMWGPTGTNVGDLHVLLAA